MIKTSQAIEDADFWIGFGAELRFARESQGRSLRSIARQLELSPSYLSQVELGQKGINFVRLLKFCECYELKLDYVVTKLQRHQIKGKGPVYDNE